MKALIKKYEYVILRSSDGDILRTSDGDILRVKVTSNQKWYKKGSKGVTVNG